MNRSRRILWSGGLRSVVLAVVSILLILVALPLVLVAAGT